MTNKIESCDKCKAKVKFKYLKKLPSGFYCRKCYSNRRKERRDLILHTEGGVRRRADLIKERAMKREERSKRIFNIQKQYTRHTRLPIFPSLKPITSKVRTPALGLYLTSEEKRIIYIKYVNELGCDKARQRVNEILEILNNLIQNLRQEKKSEKEISNRFKEEFAKMVQNDK